MIDDQNENELDDELDDVESPEDPFDLSKLNLDEYDDDLREQIVEFIRLKDEIASREKKKLTKKEKASIRRKVKKLVKTLTKDFPKPRTKIKRVYIAHREKAYDLLRHLAKRYTKEPIKIWREKKFGKPHITGNPFYFSISYTDNYAAIVVDKNTIGVDIETVKKPRKIESIVQRMHLRERANIYSYEQFLYYWTAKEAFTKAIGTVSIWQIVKNSLLHKGRIYYKNVDVGVNISQIACEYGVVSVCHVSKFRLKISDRTKRY